MTDCVTCMRLIVIAKDWEYQKRSMMWFLESCRVFCGEMHCLLVKSLLFHIGKHINTI